MIFRSLLIIISCLFPVGVLTAQNGVIDLMEEAEALYKNGNYHVAIEKLQQADQLKPNTPSILTELARNYFARGKYDEAVEYADLVLKMDSDRSAQAGLIKGSALDASGRLDEAIQVFQHTIENTGGDFLLHYNLALSYYQKGRLLDAEDQILKAIEMNPGHADLHLMLGYIQNEMGNRVRCILALHYFLFLEPHSERSLGAYNLMRDHFDGNVLAKENFGQMEDENSEIFNQANEALQSIRNSRQNNGIALFENQTKLFFIRLHELKPADHNSIWWDFYIPFFNKVANSSFIGVYCKYVGQTASQSAKQWLQNNREELIRFDDWLMGE